MASSPQQYVSLVVEGGTPVRLADQRGAPFPTTGTGALVFNQNPTIYDAELIDPIISGAVFPADQAQTSNYGIDTGPTANTYVVAFDPVITVASDGMPLRIRALHSNTGASTVDLGYGAIPIQRRNGSALIGGEILANQPFSGLAFSDHFQLLSIAPASTAAAFAGTDTQSAITPAELAAIAIVIDINGDVTLPRDLYVTRDLFVGRNGTFTGNLAADRLAIDATFTTVSGTTVTNTVEVTFSGNVDGTTDTRVMQARMAVVGANNVSNSIVINNQTELQHTAGTVATAIGMDTYVRLGLSTQNPQWAGSATNVFGLRTHIANESALGNIGNAYSLYVQAIDLADPVGTPRGTVQFAHGLHVDQQQGQPNLGPGVLLIPGRVVQEAIGVYVSNMNAGAALTASYFSHMQNDSPDQVTYPKYALYFDGSASSIHRGAMTVGDLVDPTGVAIFEVTQSIEAQVAATYFGVLESINVAGAPAATGDFRAFRQNIQLVGANGMASIELASSSLNLNSTAGVVAAANGFQGTIAVNGNANVTSLAANTWAIFHNSNAVVTTAVGYTTLVAFQGGTGTITNTKGILIGEQGGPRVTGTAIGVDVTEQTAISGGGVQAGLRSALSLQGANRYNIFANGTAPSIFAGNVTVGDVTASTASTLQVTSTLGTLATAAAVTSINITAQMTANADGLSDYRAFKSLVQPVGANSYTLLQSQDNQLDMNVTAGTIAAAHGVHAFVRQSGAAAVTLSRVMSAQIYVNGAGNFTAATAIYAKINFQAGAGTVTTARGIHIDNVGGTRVSSVAVGLDIEGTSGITGGGINAAIRTNASAGGNQWSIYSIGTASSAHVGSLSLGQSTAPVAKLDILANLTAAPAGTVIGSILSTAAITAADVGGTTDYRNFKQIVSLAGANSAVGFLAHEAQVEVNHTAGTLTTGGVSDSYIRLGGAGAATTLRAHRTRVLLNGAGNTTTAEALNVSVAFQGGAGTVGTTRGIHVQDVGGTRVTTEAIAIEVDGLGAITGGGIVAALRSGVASGTNRWFLYNSSTAPSNFGASYLQFTEMTAPAAGAADQTRLFTQDNGAGKTQLMAIFSSGAAQQIAIQP